ncbi:MAG: MBL fold metallo-hydrolase [Porphyromonadaceae bacterium]|jgi:metallo-beta-lactamase family protein|nr:MBL fold metallo-hydrolase [Porphyromonadaceae bacterium]
MKIKFLGAAREVTGSKVLLTTNEGKKILIDCGMFQGKGLETDGMNRNIGVEPSELDHIILSHAHIDHSGLIPYLYKLGFRGSVICTNATRNLCSIMLPDSGHIQELDAKWFNKKQARKKLPFIEPIYGVEDAEKSLSLFIGIDLNRRFNIDDKINVKFTNTGHMLGGGVVNLEINEDGKIIRLAYTGDIGRPYNRILRPPAPFPQCDFLITESTYGNRIHEPMNDVEKEFFDIIHDTCVVRKGKLIIPSFAIGRTQELVYLLNTFFNDGTLPNIDVYVDSPLAVNATDIFRMHLDCLNDDVNREMHNENDADPFGFNRLHYIKKADDSKKLNDDQHPAIIISASGMAEAGRIKHHISNNIEDSKNTILIVGYCSPTSLGARIQEPGRKEISIFGNMHQINAKIERIEAFSGHGDYNEMKDFLNCQDKSRVKQTFLVHGEYEVQQFYAGVLSDDGFKNVEIPAPGEEFEVH